MGWISVEEDKPPFLRKVLFLWVCPGGNKNVSMGYLCGGSNGGWDIYLPYHSYKLHNERITVTHWMELPEYPKDEKEKLELDERTKEFAKRFIDENIDLLKRMADR